MTDSDSVYERLVWMTQHPVRQARDLGLGRVNELALNARIHPWAAVEANRTFDQSLAALGPKRARATRLFEVLRSVPDVSVSDCARLDLEPSFFRVVARSSGESADLTPIEQALGRAGMPADLLRRPIELLYRQPAFPASRRRDVRRCRIAEAVADTAFAVVERRDDAC